MHYESTYNFAILNLDVSCGDFPKSLDNGVITAPNRTDYGAVIKYSCNDKFTLVGVSERTCKEDGKWTPEALPQCLGMNI